jgi:hypothetical protein
MQLPIQVDPKPKSIAAHDRREILTLRFHFGGRQQLYGYIGQPTRPGRVKIELTTISRLAIEAGDRNEDRHRKGKSLFIERLKGIDVLFIIE